MDLKGDEVCIGGVSGVLVRDEVTPHGESRAVGFSFVGLVVGDDVPIGGDFVRWDLGVVDEVDGVCTNNVEGGDTV